VVIRRLGNGYHLSRLRKGFSTSWLLWICSPGTWLSWKLSNSLEHGISAWRHWRLLLSRGQSHRCSTSDQGCQFTSGDSCKAQDTRKIPRISLRW